MDIRITRRWVLASKESAGGCSLIVSYRACQVDASPAVSWWAVDVGWLDGWCRLGLTATLCGLLENTLGSICCLEVCPKKELMTNKVQYSKSQCSEFSHNNNIAVGLKPTYKVRSRPSDYTKGRGKPLPWAYHLKFPLSQQNLLFIS